MLMNLATNAAKQIRDEVSNELQTYLDVYYRHQTISGG